MGVWIPQKLKNFNPPKGYTSIEAAGAAFMLYKRMFQSPEGVYER